MESTDEEDTMVTRIVEVLPAAPMSLAELAKANGTTESDRIFRYTVWQAMERYRDETGIQLVQRAGCIEVTTPEEQLAEAKKRFHTAQVRVRRGYEIAHGAARRDPEVGAKVERMIARQASRSAPVDSGALTALEDQKRAALLSGAKT